jgi:hypothetical protein
MANLINIEFRLDGMDPVNMSVGSGSAPLATSFDPNIISPDAASSNTSFNYSGRHDHGPLPQLNRDGPYAILICALQDAKQQTDIYLNSIQPLSIATTNPKKTAEDNENEGSDNDDDEGMAKSASKKPKLDTDR